LVLVFANIVSVKKKSIYNTPIFVKKYKKKKEMIKQANERASRDNKDIISYTAGTFHISRFCYEQGSKRILDKTYINSQQPLGESLHEWLFTS